MTNSMSDHGHLGTLIVLYSWSTPAHHEKVMIELQQRTILIVSNKFRSNLRCLHECNVVALQKDSPYSDTAFSMHHLTGKQYRKPLSTFQATEAYTLCTYLEVSCSCVSGILLQPRQVPSSCTHQSPATSPISSQQTMV